MRRFTWDEYHEGFYDWSLSTQKNYSYGLTSYGDADEVFEVVSEFAFYDKSFASRFVDKALDAGVRFTPDQVLEIEGLIEKTVLSRMAENTARDFTAEELEEINMLIDDDAFERISNRLGIDIFADDSPSYEGEPEEEEVYELEEEYDYAPAPKKLGFFTTLFAVIAGISMASGSKKKPHNGKCNGDCANCPPHYGYRYGRWYYGHGHVRGCEFGGNKGDGSLPY